MSLFSLCCDWMGEECTELGCRYVKWFASAPIDSACLVYANSEMISIRSASLSKNDCNKTFLEVAIPPEIPFLIHRIYWTTERWKEFKYISRRKKKCERNDRRTISQKQDSPHLVARGIFLVRYFREYLHHSDERNLFQLRFGRTCIVIVQKQNADKLKRADSFSSQLQRDHFNCNAPRKSTFRAKHVLDAVVW